MYISRYIAPGQFAWVVGIICLGSQFVPFSAHNAEDSLPCKIDDFTDIFYKEVYISPQHHEMAEPK